MKMIKLFFVSVFCLTLAACATGAKVENMSVEPANAEKTRSYDRALSYGVKVSDVTGGKKTNPAWTSEISSEAFAAALKASLAAEGIYLENGRYSLSAELLEVKQPALGLSMKVTTHIKYLLTDTASNDNVLLDETLVVPYTATMGDAFAGVKRLRLANEGSARANIDALLDKISELKITGVSVGQ